MFDELEHLRRMKIQKQKRKVSLQYQEYLEHFHILIENNVDSRTGISGQQS